MGGRASIASATAVNIIAGVGVNVQAGASFFTDWEVVTFL